MSKHVLCVFWQNIYNLTYCSSVSTRHLIQNTHKLTMSTPWLTSEGEVWGVFCEFNLWPKFVIMVQNTISPKWQFLMNYVHGFKWYCHFDNVRCDERQNKIVKMATFRSSELFVAILLAIVSCHGLTRTPMCINWWKDVIQTSKLSSVWSVKEGWSMSRQLLLGLLTWYPSM